MFPEINKHTALWIERVWDYKGDKLLNKTIRLCVWYFLQLQSPLPTVYKSESNTELFQLYIKISVPPRWCMFNMRLNNKYIKSRLCALVVNSASSQDVLCSNCLSLFCCSCFHFLFNPNELSQRYLATALTARQWKSRGRQSIFFVCCANHHMLMGRCAATATTLFLYFGTLPLHPISVHTTHTFHPLSNFLSQDKVLWLWITL